MSKSAVEWLSAFAARLGVEVPSDSECDEILALAGAAAHASERMAAPIACWLAAQAGVSAHEARTMALQIEVSDNSSGAALTQTQD